MENREVRELREVFDRLLEKSSSKSSASTTKTWSLKKVISKELWQRKLSSVFRWKRVDLPKKVISKELWQRKLSSVFRWKRVDLPLSIIDDVVFKILSVVEAVVLVSTLCFFFLCCGCHI